MKKAFGTSMKSRIFDTVLVLLIFGLMALANAVPQAGHENTAAAGQHAAVWANGQE
ncbi:MAG: hypothetical protein J6Z38_01755 [Lachnospiraceae bacterium]|nr:hypothetical protein [Lachnospiraceae bacterium]